MSKGDRRRMNQVSKDQRPPEQAQSPWKDCAALSEVASKYKALALIAIAVCSLGLPFLNHTIVAPCLIALLFGAVVLLARARRTVIFLLVSSAIVSMLFGMAIAAVFLGLIVGCAASTYLFTVDKKGYACGAILIPALVSVLVFLITRDVIASILSLAFLPAAALLAFATLTDRGRTTAICYAMGGFLLTALAMIAVLVYQYQGELTVEALQRGVDGAREAFADLLIRARDLMVQMLTEMADEQTKVAYEQMLEMASDSLLRDVAGQIFTLLPALLTVTCSVLAFEAQVFLNASYRRSGLEAVLTENATRFTMSLTASMLYLIGFLLMIVLPMESVACSAAQNLTLILTPGLCLCGLMDLRILLIRAKGGTKAVLIVLLVSVLSCTGVSAIYMLAFWGAYAKIVTVLKQKMIEKMNGMHGPDGN